MSTVVKLDYPVEVDGHKYSEIEIRRPKARDIKLMEKATGGDVAKGAELIVHLSELPPEVIDELDALDFNKLSGVVSGFLEKK